MLLEKEPRLKLCYVFLCLRNLSLKDVVMAIHMFVKRSGTAIWKWLQKCQMWLVSMKNPFKQEVTAPRTLKNI